MRRFRVFFVRAVAVAFLSAGCSVFPPGQDAASLTLPTEKASNYATAYLARVVPAPEGDDLADGAGEYVVIKQNTDIRIDMGGWYIVDSDGNRLDLGIGRQIDAGAELQVYTSCGEETQEKVFACVGQEVLDDEGDVLRLLDSAGGEGATFPYGTVAE